MANNRRLGKLRKKNRLLNSEADKLRKDYYGNEEIQRFDFNLEIDVLNINQFLEIVDIQITDVNSPADAKIHLEKKGILSSVEFGCFTFRLLKQIRKKKHGNESIAGIALTIGKIDEEICIVLDLYVIRNGKKVIISTDGGGGDNLTPTSIPPKK